MLLYIERVGWRGGHWVWKIFFTPLTKTKRAWLHCVNVVSSNNSPNLMVLKFRILSISFDLLIPRALGLWEEKKNEGHIPQTCGLWRIVVHPNSAHPSHASSHQPHPTTPNSPVCLWKESSPLQLIYCLMFFWKWDFSPQNDTNLLLVHVVTGWNYNLCPCGSYPSTKLIN